MSPNKMCDDNDDLLSSVGQSLQIAGGGGEGGTCYAYAIQTAQKKKAT